MKRVFKIAIKVVAWTALVVIAGVALLLASMWLDHTRETRLPLPTGPFAVGRTNCVWTDPAQAELMAPQAGTKRELLAWIWYPAAPQPPGRRADDYLPSAFRRAMEKWNGPVLANLLTRDLSRVRANGFRDVEVSAEQHSYPVVLMRAGLAAQISQYTSLAEDLASHGYVVVGFDAPYRSSITVFPDGRVIERAEQNNADVSYGAEREKLAARLVEAWTSDMSFALDQLGRMNAADPTGRFVGRLDMERVGAFGHSLGGATALEFCHDDARCKAGIDVDGAPLGSVVNEGVNRPVMFLLSDHSREPGAETDKVISDIHSIYERLPREARLEVILRGANHFGFSDDGAMLKSPLLMTLLGAAGVVRLNGRRQIAVSEHFISGFFDVHLKGAPDSGLIDSSGYPEAEFVH